MISTDLQNNVNHGGKLFTLLLSEAELILQDFKSSLSFSNKFRCSLTRIGCHKAISMCELFKDVTQEACQQVAASNQISS